MMHPLDRVVASDLSQQVLEARRLRGEVGPCALDSTNRRLYPLPSVIVQREAFIASRETIHSTDQWEIERQRRIAQRRG